MLLLLVAGAHAYQSGISQQLLAKIETRYGHGAVARIQKWQRLIDAAATLDEAQKLERVNDFFNGATFTTDIKQWGKSDYWATPLEFLISDAGDCEDFSIAKYFTLKAMNVDTTKLRITYVKALSLNQAHMVLAYYPTPDAIPLILDNINKRIRLANERTDLFPVYSFNTDDLWLSRSRNLSIKAGKPQQLGPWINLNQRMEEELLTNP